MTQSASDTMTHGELPEGPLAGVSGTARVTLIYEKSNKTVLSGNENVAGGDTEEVSMQAAAVYPSTDGNREYWIWCSGYKVIDWGVVAPEVTISNVTESSADISWTDTLSQFEGTGHSYRIEISKVSDFNTVVKRTRWSSLKYSISDLDANTTYYVRIQAIRKIVDGDSSFMKSSDWSDTYEFTTLATEAD
ncbi:MAG: fibronectin type III domain-containing protein [Lachnospiraceae bacterium]|nr:fibronectin type III domain-containing protein [Lachnospiraceae bacterium]MCI7617836.1 fibronectin type III domain-containing protein [Bacillota bacterium]